MQQAEKMNTVVKMRRALPVSSCIGWALRRLWTRRTTALAIILVVVASLPMYLGGYAHGQWPVLGLVVSIGLGAILTGAVVAMAFEDRIDVGAIGTGMDCVSMGGCLFGVWFGLGLAGMSWGLMALIGDWALPQWESFMDNSLAWWWKPIAHISAGGALFLGSTPFLVLPIIVRLRTGMDMMSARTWVVEYMHGSSYNQWSLMVWCMGLAMVAFVPVIGLICVPTAAWMAVRFYAYAYASR